MRLTKFLFLFLFLYSFSLYGQKPCPTYDEAMNTGNKLAGAGRYEEAMMEYLSAQVAARECKLVTKDPQNALKKSINALKKQRDDAIAAERRAKSAEQKAGKQTIIAKKALEQAKKDKQAAEIAKIAAEQEKQKTQAVLQTVDSLNRKNQKLVNAFYFYDGKFALAYKNKEYGFISKEGDIVIDYKYNEAENFDNTGFAKVKKEGIDYLLDTLGKEYKVAYKIEDLKGDIIALDMRGIQLDSFPNSSLEHKPLQILILNGRINSKNNFKTIPNHIHQLTQLKNLQLVHCNIDSLSELNLPQLRSLNLSYNRIKKIEGLNNLTKLESLHLNNNFFITKIEGLDAFSQLHFLNLSHTRIRKIEGLDNLKKLKYLHLNNNSIVKIEGLNNLKQLQYLNLNAGYRGRANITKIEGLDSLKKLTYLDLRHNPIHKIEGLNNLKQLKSLSLSAGLIKKIEGLNNLKNLQYLDLRYSFQGNTFYSPMLSKRNKINKIEEINNLPLLQSLSLSNNSMTKEVIEKLRKKLPNCEIIFYRDSS